MKKNKIFTILAMIVMAGSFVLTGCFGPTEKVFEADGIKIVATSAFYEKEHISFNLYLQSNDALIAALKEEKSLLNADDLNEYTSLIITANNLTGTTYESFDEEEIVFNHFYYEKTVSGKNFSYLAVTKEGQDYFYLFNFACEKNNYENYEETFLDWAKKLEVA